MKKFALVLVFILAALPARADPIPGYMLDKEYETCMSGPTQGLDEQKRNYCLCIRNQLATWDLDAYSKVAQDAATSTSGAPAALEEIAKACIAQTLK